MLTRRMSARVLCVALLLLPSMMFGTTECVTAKPASGCCKICTKGKACGNTCIARWKTCHVGPGCACNARSAGVEDAAVPFAARELSLVR